MIGKALKELTQARGAHKIMVLKKYSGDQDVRLMLWYTYNMDYVYHVKPAPASPLNCFERTSISAEEIELLTALDAKEISGNAAHAAVARVVAKHGPLIKLILRRDLQCGVAATSINKAIPGYIPQFKVQLAKEVPLDKVKFPCWAQLKYDGVRLITTIKDGHVRFRTRNGKGVNLPYFESIFANAPVDNMMFDGELIIKGGGMTDRTSVSGMVNSAMHGGRINERVLEYAIFDHMPLTDFEAAECPTIYSSRFKCVETLVPILDNEKVTVAHKLIAESPEQISVLAQSLYRKGQEGLVLKSPTHLYTFKRSKDWVKIKETKTADLMVLGATVGTGKYDGMVGALDCIGKVEGREIIVSVGSGLSDAQRDVDLDHYDNETIEVKYNSVIRDSKTGQWSLFLPRFTHVRIDK